MFEPGTVAIVTGASRNPGLGRSIGLALADRGVALMLTGRSNARELELNAADARTAGVTVLHRLADVTDAAEVGRVVQDTLAAFDRIDILVHCAGGRSDFPLLDLPLEEWHRVLAVNLDGAFHLTRAVAPHMIARGQGRIILIAGASGQLGDPQRAHVVTANAGVLGFVRAAASELGPHGITVNALSPGLIDSPRSAGAGIALRQRRIAAAPLRRLGHGTDVAQAALFIASEAASFITGQSINVNGGIYMG